MASFSFLDSMVIIAFFAIILIIGFISSRKSGSDSEDYLLSGRKIGLLLFVTTNVSTWYGGILGVGEFTYKYGLLNWVTQCLPYYIFALIFGLFFAKRIRRAKVFSIPDKIEKTYGKETSILSAIIVFILLSPAPYLLMTGNLLYFLFDIDIIIALIISAAISTAYLFKGGFRANIYVDLFQFFIMFTGFFVATFLAYNKFGGLEYLRANLPETHLTPTGGAPAAYIIVWFLIALWTFIDPGFHQRCSSAKNESVASRGIIISIFFWILFDLLTTTVGLFSRAVLGDIPDPTLAFPLFADLGLNSGIKGLFIAGLFATIISTLISFTFLSGAIFGRDIIYRLRGDQDEENVKKYSNYGIIAASVLSIALSIAIPSVIELWYSIGSLFIPSIFFITISSYFERIKIPHKIAVYEIIIPFLLSLTWLIVREKYFNASSLYFIEPMIIGLTAAFIIHAIGMISVKRIN